MDVTTGLPESHPEFEYDPSLSPPLANVTVAEPDGTEQGGVRDTVAEQAQRLDDLAAQIGAAQLAGMDAENGRRTNYHREVLPQGAPYGQPIDLPPVPAYDFPAAAEHYFGGDEPGH